MNADVIWFGALFVPIWVAWTLVFRMYGFFAVPAAVGILWLAFGT